ncbi:macrophage mannose receptor 1-like [Sardina pilchardus]|uniref:macrophage mannose receptor 1-like n=1 Tax=Sardina pilchardus TaxID=27697 RepID=UPI002E12BADD
MAAAVVTLLFLSGLFSSCLCEPLSIVPQYHLVTKKLNWKEAQNYCRTHHSDLISIRSQGDQTNFHNYINPRYPTAYVWIGLYNDINSWRWSLDSSGLEQIGFSNWSSGEPDNFKGHESCADFHNGTWSDSPCTLKHPFICYDEKETAANQYILISLLKPWSAAQEYCREHHTDLASSRSQEENQQVAQASDHKRVWIGLFRDTWKWSDQSKTRFTSWTSSEPNNGQLHDNCAKYYTYRSYNQWYDALCTEKLGFVCESATPHRQVVKVTISTDSPLNMNDPAVQAAMAEQIHQKLLAEGQPVTRVTWRQQADGNVLTEKKDKKANKKRAKRDEL